MYYSQKDYRWKDKKIGFGTTTFGSSGCLLVSVANKLKFDGVKMTPLQVNDLAKKCGAFNVDMLNLAILAKALGYTYVRQTAKPEGRYIFETNYYKKVGVPQHFCFGNEDGKRIDPLDLEPSWEVNNYPIISYRVMNRITPKIAPVAAPKVEDVKLPTPEPIVPPSAPEVPIIKHIEVKVEPELIKLDELPKIDQFVEANNMPVDNSEINPVKDLINLIISLFNSIFKK